MPGFAYFAVTPEFAHKCKMELLSRGVFDYDYTQFDRLPAFEMDPIDSKMIYELALKIREVHGPAHAWDAADRVPDRVLQNRCRELGESPIPDRVRQAIIGIVRVLDDKFQG